MKIVHIPTGEAYQLSPDTCLEVERTNLFFNEYGEQTLPVTLPDTPLNRRLTGNPEQLANLERPSTDIECTITDGDYFCTCRQAVLGARRNEGITTTFYMNEGSFLSRLQRTPLTDVFGSETVPGVQTVEQGIAWCWSLRTNTDPNFSIFPAIVEMDGERRVLNAMAEMEADGTPLNNGRTVTGLYNAWSRTEQVDGRTISLTPGYYITPFIRCTYVLRRVFAYFGYELLEGFFDKTPPFNGMVFINTTMDTLVNGDILLAHLVPDCLCSDLIDLFRKKFCCEFIPDEAARTVAVRFFNELLDEKPQVDLTFFMDGHPSVEYATRRQLKLSSATSLTDCNSFDSLKELKEKYPTAYCNASNGCYYRDGHAVGDYSELLSEGNIPYFADDGLEEYEVTVPDCQPCPATATFHTEYGTDRNGNAYTAFTLERSALYAGEARALNSTIVISNGSIEEEESGEGATEGNKTDRHDQKPVLAFVQPGTGPMKDVSVGTVTVKDSYSLLYNAPGGIYEVFWRQFDLLLRHSLNNVSAQFLLPSTLKSTLRVHSPVLFEGVKCFPNKVGFTLGGGNRPAECTLLTTNLQRPACLPPIIDMDLPEYYWEQIGTSSPVDEEHWKAAGFTPQTTVKCPSIFPPAPTASQVVQGGTWYEREVWYSYYRSGRVDGTGGQWFYRHAFFALKPCR